MAPGGPGHSDQDLLGFASSFSHKPSMAVPEKSAGPLQEAKNAIFSCLVDKTAGEHFDRLNSSALPTLQSRSHEQNSICNKSPSSEADNMQDHHGCLVEGERLSRGSSASLISPPTQTKKVLSKKFQ